MGRGKIYTNVARLSKVLGVSRTSVYRRMKSKKESIKLKSRVSKTTGNIEVEVPEEYVNEYKKLFNR